MVLKKTMVAMTETFASFFKACRAKKYIDENSDPIFLTQSLMGIMHHFMRTEQTRERLMSHKTLKHDKSKELIVENIIALFLERK